MSTIEEILARLERTADRIDELVELAHQRERELVDCDCIECVDTFDLTLTSKTGSTTSRVSGWGGAYKESTVAPSRSRP